MSKISTIFIRNFASLPSSRPSQVKDIPFLRPIKESFTGAKHVIAIGSGKGGVGKSSVSVNVAIGLANLGYRVGLLDTDIYGPSIPKLMHLQDQRPFLTKERKMIPLDNYGVRCMSVGFITKEDSALVWRGMMVQKVLQQLMHATEWNEDILVIDLPPGTGDVQLTVAQQLPLSHAIIVTTPQDVSLIDAVKGADMFKSLKIPVLGIVENMSSFTCPQCKTVSDIFGKGAGKRMSDKLGLELLAKIPISIDVCDSGEEGKPIIIAQPDHAISKIYIQICKRIQDKMVLNDS